MKFIEGLHKQAIDRRNELSSWIAHSKLVTCGMVVRVCEDIVKLLQQKNLMLEYQGKRFIKVGPIEEQVGYKMRVTRHPIDGSRDYFERKLEFEIDDGELVIQIAERELHTNNELSLEMTEWLSGIEGNPQWARLVAARQLRKRQQY